jgi:hypothetical protein
LYGQRQSACNLLRGCKPVAIDRNQAAGRKWPLTRGGVYDPPFVYPRRLRRREKKCLMRVGVICSSARTSRRSEDHSAHCDSIQAMAWRGHRLQGAPRVCSRVVLLVLSEGAFWRPAVPFATKDLYPTIDRSASQSTARGGN